MAAIDFPNSPTNGQVFSSGELTWVYATGTGWLLDSGSGGTDEVWIGPTQPTDSAIELWYDTDDVSAGAGMWNTAWGQLARGTISGGQIQTAAASTDVGAPLVVAVAAGRRYRLRFQAFIYGDTTNYIQLGIKTNGVNWGGAASVGSGSGNGQSTQCETIFEATTNNTLTVQPYYGVYYGGGNVVMRPDVVAAWYTVDDVGPIVADSGVLPTAITQWNAAWGVVAKATMKVTPVNAPANVWTAVSDSLSMSLLVGRRYALRGNVRAFQGSGTTGMMMGIFRDGAQAWDNHQNISGPAAFNHGVITAYLDGDGVTRTYDMRIIPTNGTAVVHTDQATGFFLIEDVGPVSGAQPISNPSPRYGARFRRSANQSLPANVSTAIVWDVEEEDTHGYGAVGSHLIVIPANCGGIYTVTAQLYLGTGPMGADVDLVFPGIGFQGLPSNRTGWAAVSATVPLAVGATIQANGWNQAGFAGCIGTLQLYRVGP